MSSKKIIRIMKTEAGDYEVRWREGPHRKLTAEIFKDPYQAELFALSLFENFGGPDAVEAYDHRDAPPGKVKRIFTDYAWDRQR